MEGASFYWTAARTLYGVAVVYVVLVMLASGVAALAEGWSYGDAVWWSFVTATTVGYGDMSPVTFMGRATAFVLMHLGPGFIFPLATAIIASKLIVDRDAFTHDEQELLKENQRKMLEQIDCLMERVK